VKREYFVEESVIEEESIKFPSAWTTLYFRLSFDGTDCSFPQLRWYVPTPFALVPSTN
jgi:hypothetical protein